MPDDTPTRRPRNRRGEGDRLRGEVVDAAAELLAARGVEELSLRAVARAVGITAPAVYLHFADKEALVWAVLRQRFDELQVIVTAAASSETDPGDALLAWCTAYVGFGLGHPGHYRVLFESWNAHRVELPLSELPGSGVFSSLVDVVTAARPASPDEDVPLLVWAGLHGIVSLRINKPSFPWPPAEQLVREMVARLVRAVPGDPAV